MKKIYALLTVHPSITFVNKPTWHTNCCVCLFIFPTCFGQPCAHHRENYCINATSGLCHSV